MSSRLLVAALTAALAAPVDAVAQDWRTITETRRRGAETGLEVDVEYGAGRFELSPADAGTLYRATLRYDASDFEPEMDYRDGRLEVGIDGDHDDIDLGHDEQSGRLVLALGAAVPLEIDLAFGAVEADLELGGLRVQALQIATGASETDLRFSQPNPERCRAIDLEVGAASFRVYGLGNANANELRLDGGLGDIVLDFTGEWQSDMRADIDIGLGSVEIRVPHGLGVRISQDSFLASFDADGFVRRDGAYYSEAWETSERRLTLNIDAAFGSIDVRWVENAGVTL